MRHYKTPEGHIVTLISYDFKSGEIIKYTDINKFANDYDLTASQAIVMIEKQKLYSYLAIKFPYVKISYRIEPKSQIGKATQDIQIIYKDDAKYKSIVVADVMQASDLLHIPPEMVMEYIYQDVPKLFNGVYVRILTDLIPPPGIAQHIGPLPKQLGRGMFDFDQISKMMQKEETKKKKVLH